MVTGQTTQYSSKLDDGYYEKGLAKRYEVLTASQYSSTSNIDLIHLTAATISFSQGTKQIETATIVATITTAGNATITVTAVGMANTPKAISVAVALEDTASLVAGKVRTALAADADVSAFFDVSGATDKVVLTAKVKAANDTTMNIASADGTSVGITAAATSADTLAGDVIQKILDSANGLAIFKTGDTIVITSSTSNNGVLTVATGNVAAEIVTTEALVDEAAGASVSIAKREAHSNNCVLDQNTGLMYSRYVANKMGAASDGKLPWYDATKLYDIFTYCAAANAAALGGYTDWRIPNKKELDNLCNMEAPNALPDAAAFPSWPSSDWIWSATTLPVDTSYALIVIFSLGTMSNGTKVTPYFVALVRG